MKIFIQTLSIVFLLQAVLSFSFCEASLRIAKVGDTVELVCHTEPSGVDWIFLNPIGHKIYSDSVVPLKYREICNVSTRDSTSSHLSIKIVSSSVAGEYRCVKDQHVDKLLLKTNLIVQQPNSTCGSHFRENNTDYVMCNFTFATGDISSSNLNRTHEICAQLKYESENKTNASVVYELLRIISSSIHLSTQDNVTCETRSFTYADCAQETNSNSSMTLFVKVVLNCTPKDTAMMNKEHDLYLYISIGASVLGSTILVICTIIFCKKFDTCFKTNTRPRKQKTSSIDALETAPSVYESLTEPGHPYTGLQQRQQYMTIQLPVIEDIRPSTHASHFEYPSSTTYMHEEGDTYTEIPYVDVDYSIIPSEGIVTDNRSNDAVPSTSKERQEAGQVPIPEQSIMGADGRIYLELVHEP